MSRFVLPFLTGLVILAAWAAAHAAGLFPPGTVPSPLEVASTFGAEITSGRLATDVIASLFRVAWGFITAVVTAVPLGLVVGRHARTRDALLPWINFFRSLSPIAWIPFAILWFGVGDNPAIFIIFIATLFQVAFGSSMSSSSRPDAISSPNA